MIQLKTSKDLTEEQLRVYKVMHERSHVRVFEKRFRQEVITWIKEIKRLINEYSKPKPCPPEESGSFWKTEDGKQFKELEKIGIIQFTDESIHIEGEALLKHFFNITEEDLK